MNDIEIAFAMMEGRPEALQQIADVVGFGAVEARWAIPFCDDVIAKGVDDAHRLAAIALCDMRRRNLWYTPGRLVGFMASTATIESYEEEDAWKEDIIRMAFQSYDESLEGILRAMDEGPEALLRLFGDVTDLTVRDTDWVLFHCHQIEDLMGSDDAIYELAAGVLKDIRRKKHPFTRGLFASYLIQAVKQKDPSDIFGLPRIIWEEFHE